MPLQADRLIVGENYPIEIESLEPQQEDPNSFQFKRVPLVPDGAFVSLLDVQTGVFVPLGSSSDEAMATISGNIIRYTIPESKLTVPGDYKVFVRVTYPDGRVKIDVRKLKVIGRL